MSGDLCLGTVQSDFLTTTIYGHEQAVYGTSKCEKADFDSARTIQRSETIQKNDLPGIQQKKCQQGQFAIDGESDKPKQRKPNQQALTHHLLTPTSNSSQKLFSRPSR